MARKRAVAEPIFDGFAHPDFLSAATAPREQVRGRPGGATVCVHHRGRRVADLRAGVRDAAGTPWTAATISPSFSAHEGRRLDPPPHACTPWPRHLRRPRGEVLARVRPGRQEQHHGPPRPRTPVGALPHPEMIDHADRMLD